MDLSSKCIESCKQRFAYASHISYHINDGRSLDMIENRSIDFVFSFDSLVHAEADVLESYLDQLSNKLKPHGVGLIHHSNLLQYREVLSIVDSIPEEFQEAIIATQLMAPRHSHTPAYQLVCLKNYVTKPHAMRSPGSCELGNRWTPHRLHLGVHPEGLEMGKAKQDSREPRLHGRGSTDQANV